MTAFSSFNLDLILRLGVPWVNNCKSMKHRNSVHIEVLISLQTPLNFMWYDPEMCASMQQQLNRLNSWHSSRLNAVIKHVKNRKRVVSISSPGGETVKWIKKSRSSCPEVFCKKEVLKNFSKFTGKHLYRRLFKKRVTGLKVVSQSIGTISSHIKG